MIVAAQTAACALPDAFTTAECSISAGVARTRHGALCEKTAKFRVVADKVFTLLPDAMC